MSIESTNWHWAVGEQLTYLCVSSLQLQEVATQASSNSKQRCVASSNIGLQGDT